MAGIALPIDYDESDEGPEFPALQHRIAQSGLMAGNGDPFGVLDGLRPSSPPVVTIEDGIVTIQPFACIVDPGGNDGAYLVAFKTAETVTLTAAPGSNSRLDRIDVQVPSDPPTGDRVASIVYTDTGTAAADPTAPDAPSRSINVGFVTVPSSGDPVWSAGTEFAVAAGGIRPASTDDDGVYVGQYIDDPDVGLCRWDGSDWVRYIPAPLAPQAGTITIANPATTAAVTFPVAFPSGTNVYVAVCPITASPMTYPTGASGISETGFTARISRVSSGSADVPVHWIAVPSRSS